MRSPLKVNSARAPRRGGTRRLCLVTGALCMRRQARHWLGSWMVATGLPWITMLLSSTRVLPACPKAACARMRGVSRAPCSVPRRLVLLRRGTATQGWGTLV